MIPSRTFFLLLLALLVFCFGIAAKMESKFEAMPWSRTKSGDIFYVLLGEDRAMFAQHFYVKADAYYHSGFYPTIFDNRTNFETTHMAADTGAVNNKNQGEDEGFLGPSRNWIDSFGRHFFPDRHTHLDEGGASGDLSNSSEIREILPWLKLSADLDPHNPQTYTVTAYWLRERMHKTNEAAAFLHEGLRNNPDSYDILFELGRLYYESYHDINRARNVWELAAKKWHALPPEQQDQNHLIMDQIATHLAELEQNAGNLTRALNWLRIAKSVTREPAAVQKRMDELEEKIAAQSHENSSTNSIP